MEETLSYTPEEVAKLLKITRFTVYEMIKRGDLPAYRIGRKMRIESPDLDTYIRDRKTQGGRAGSDSQQPALKSLNAAKASELIFCGQDVMLDILTRYLESALPHVRVLRSYVGSIDGLLAMYRGTANAVTTHLWDSDSDNYNVPYVRRLLPGYRSLLINLTFRIEGFYVQKGNPKNLQGWQDLTRPEIRFVNRERGSGARVLLDEKMRLLNIAAERIAGYEHEERSHLAVASYVARGEADVGLGIEKVAMQVKELDFIPLQRERYDLVIKKEDRDKEPFVVLLEILRSKAFRDEVQGMGGYDLARTGEIVAEI